MNEKRPEESPAKGRSILRMIEGRSADLHTSDTPNDTNYTPVTKEEADKYIAENFPPGYEQYNEKTLPTSFTPQRDTNQESLRIRSQISRNLDNQGNPILTFFRQLFFGRSSKK